MNRHIPILLCLSSVGFFGAGCGPDLGLFTMEFTDSVCEWTLSCGDAASLRFDGIDDLDSCRAQEGPVVQDLLAGCSYAPADGAACLSEMNELGCEEEDALWEDVLPPACQSLLDACEGENELGKASS
jgi:hypothetical protein